MVAVDPLPEKQIKIARKMKGREEENERNSFCFLFRRHLSFHCIYIWYPRYIYICYQPRITQRLVYQKTAITSGKLSKGKAKTRSRPAQWTRTQSLSRQSSSRRQWKSSLRMFRKQLSLRAQRTMRIWRRQLWIRWSITGKRWGRRLIAGSSKSNAHFVQSQKPWEEP